MESDSESEIFQATPSTSRGIKRSIAKWKRKKRTKEGETDFDTSDDEKYQTECEYESQIAKEPMANEIKGKWINS